MKFITILVSVIVAIIAFSCGSDPTGPSAGILEGMEFVTISSGSFQMGAPADEVGSSSTERPVHTVTFNYSFEIMTTEITQGMWEEVMGDNPSADYGVGPDFPVYNVSWNDSQDFITEINLLDPDYTYRLPSEAEWEYSCRRATITRYYWGDDLSTINIGYHAWYQYSAGGSTHPVAQKNMNGWDLYDICGNVYEWCQDWYHSNYDGAPTNGSAWTSPVTSDRVIRGGGWNSSRECCRSASRDSRNPDLGDNSIGFRLIRTAL